ncbi:MAG: RNA polymerase sigma-70 factor [Bacteroidota bacterium]
MSIEITYRKFDRNELEKLFREYFVQLCAFARKYVKDIDSAKEIVHDVFINLWEKRDNIDLNKSVKSYLFTSVHNRCLNFIRDNKKFDRENTEIENVNAESRWEEHDALVEAETESKIHKAIGELPEKCREIFLLNRFNDMKYAEIAEKLGISIKTVEAQMSKALKILREKLVEFITAVIIFLISML